MADPTDTLFEREDDEGDYGDESNAHRDRARSLEDLDLSGDEMSDLQKDGADASAKRTLDPDMLNELLLVCSNLGMMTETEDGGTMFTRGEDCEEWVHDLQRAIRRDHATYRLVGKTLGRWKILQKKLLPLLINHQNDWSLVFSILKVLVMLTMKPTNESDNIALQLNYLRGYKYAFLQHGVIQVLMAILVEPLSREGSSRTSQDYLNMELVLTLFRNLLAIPNEDTRLVTSATNHLARLQEDLICILHDENVFDMLLLFAEDIEAAENREWNLLVMEMLDLVLQTTSPKQLVASILAPNQSSGIDNAPATKSTPPAALAATSTSSGTAASSSSSLLSKLNQEQKNQTKSYHRHSNFGGMLVLNGVMGRKTVVTDFSKTGDQVIPQAQRKPQQRSRRSKGHGMNDISEVFGSNVSSAVDGKLGTTLRHICDTLLSKSYTSLTTSLKNEFRRGSAKLLPNDRLLYFHLIWFLTAYHRAKGPHLKKLQSQLNQEYEARTAANVRTNGVEVSLAIEAPPSLVATYDQKAILSTLDMFSFNFVLQSIESYAEVKNHHGMMLSVKLLAEMIAMLTDLGTSEDIRLQRIGHSLQHKLFYERDFLDRLPVLIKSWIPTVFSFEFATNVVTLTHLVLKMLESQGDRLKVLQKRRRVQAKKSNKTKDDEESEEETDRLIEQEMRRKEVQFDSKKYFGSMVTHESVRLYCYVLQRYKTNSPKVNHYVYAFFYRIQQFHAIEDGTMEPMLYNIHVLLVFNKMLQDTAATSRAEFRPFVDFIKLIIRNFFSLAETNHLVFVESLVRHPFAPRTCAQIQNKYTSLAMGSKDAVAIHPSSPSAEPVRRYIPREYDMDGEAEFDGTMSFGVAKPADAPSSNKPRKKRDNTKKWTKIEDRYLAKMFAKYRHLPSVFEVISYEDMFQDRDRTPDQIERRVKSLKLHKQKDYDFSTDDDDEIASNSKKPWDDSTDDDDNAKTSTSPTVPNELPRRVGRRRRLTRPSTKEDSSDDDGMDLLAQSSPRQSNSKPEDGQASPQQHDSAASPSSSPPQTKTPRLVRPAKNDDSDDDDLDMLLSRGSSSTWSPEQTKRRRGDADSLPDYIVASKRTRHDDESRVADEAQQSEVRGVIEQSEDFSFEQSVDM
ncbi:hypothetical protein H310_05196 [Aphanomyces invadans]|uniref:Timeless N-terminal domain-containing protein n=1 Tax=Aphanomyces invadans TaxID=157072 RepID=A0A024UCB1_9STRA|nr:hypothetical protein H310_05196 [Aphanomyces invadans]ETW03840.1 hypothetical protein H310_05196 [Aphanomyces invadans]|eukprot:XP_008868069.1 hypothetical protein H310_05196 [Aphanomyces invadans]